MQRRWVFALGALALMTGAAFAQEAPAPQPTAPKVVLETTMGAVEITLDPVGAPLTSAHMLRLFRSKHYVGAAVFRVEPGYLIQLGDLDAKLAYRKPPGKPVALETANSRHGVGSVSLARDVDPGSGHSSFYFDLAPNAHLNADPAAPPNTTGFATFGRVTAGWEVVEAMGKAELAPEGGPFPGKLPKTPIVINAVRVVE